MFNTIFKYDKMTKESHEEYRYTNVILLRDLGTLKTGQVFEVGTFCLQKGIFYFFDLNTPKTYVFQIIPKFECVDII